MWQCDLDLPHGFDPGDGIRLRTCGQAPTKKEADARACRLALTRLLMTRPGQVVLRPAHWTVSPEKLLANMPGDDDPHQPLPVHVYERRTQLARDAESERYVDPPQVWESRAADLLRQILRCHGCGRCRLAGLALGYSPIFFS